jgi:hypothetical protein
MFIDHLYVHARLGLGLLCRRFLDLRDHDLVVLDRGALLLDGLLQHLDVALGLLYAVPQAFDGVHQV